MLIVSSVNILIQELKGRFIAQKEGLSLHKSSTPTSASSDPKKTQVGVFPVRCLNPI